MVFPHVRWVLAARSARSLTFVRARRPSARRASRRRSARVSVSFFRYGLGSGGRRALGAAELVVANILGPLLIRFAGEIAPCASRHLVVSGILTTLYPDVLAAYAARGFAEVSRKTLGEWTTGLLARP